eukprot:496796-Pelagomonas_calceolata.AAC.3
MHAHHTHTCKHTCVHAHIPGGPYHLLRLQCLPHPPEPAHGPHRAPPQRQGRLHPAGAKVGDVTAASMREKRAARISSSLQFHFCTPGNSRPAHQAGHMPRSARSALIV